ncbi:TM0106 family RecB-like putative nuclease [Tessaracoccus antarcticus]|uniref:TM0106 family RecB-like putative nuclease n=1 Tax=Tessaracoccus antarcticus TaxID=2479848 RepID=A0A3M0G784_9ACTN|nr:TM0106 family RecB-like putative nuclease [Tessaracoccus antarcticus]RMB58222.1 TM0106 family RecB-like putative nuclease [Tessaracoccus antarcticus]
MKEFVLDAYAARSCPVKTFNAFNPTLSKPAAPLDESLRGSFDGGHDFLELTLSAILHRNSTAVDLRHRRATEAGWTVMETACIAAMEQGAPIIIGGVLPLDLEGRRSGRPDLLVRGADTTDGRPGYLPVRIKPYRVLEKQLGCTDLQYSCLEALTVHACLPDLRYRGRREGALLELAHHWRLLEACGHASTDRFGGVVGTDRLPSEGNGTVVTWVPLDLRFIRTFSRSAASGHRLRSAMERYDHEHGFRIHVAQQALRRGDDDTVAPVVRPIRVKECEWCAWWEVCRGQMDDDDLSLRISKAPLDVRELQALVSLGIRTVTELAGADVDALLPDYLPLTSHRDRSASRLRQAAQRARMLADGVSLERISSDPIRVPRADVEVDLDIETAEGDTTYLWGALVTDRRVGRSEFHHTSSFQEMDADGEVALAVSFARWLLSLIEEHPGLRVYHYSDYETVHLRRLADRSQHPDLIALCALVREHFVDLFQYVRDSMVAVDGLGLKVVATKGAGFTWRDEEPNGLASQAWYETAVHSPDPDVRAATANRVLEYNEDDVRATLAVRDWLESLDQ